MALWTKIVCTFKTIKNVHVFIGDFLGLLHQDVVYFVHGKSIKKMTARAGTPDCKEIVAVLSGDEYRLGLLPPMSHPVICDVGGHIGSFSLLMFEHFRMSLPRVYIFEPDQDNFTYLKRNLAINAIDPARYVVFNSAIGIQEGPGWLNRSGNNDSYHLSSAAEKDVAPCSVVTLPGVLARMGLTRVDILKLDIEGGEYDLLVHPPTMECLKSRVAFLMLEYHVKAGHGASFVRRCLQDAFDVVHENKEVLIFKNKNRELF
jgi:FkbM family methyltransferase